MSTFSIKRNCILIAALAMPFFAHAAILRIVEPSSVAVGQPFQVDVALDTQGENINAIQGTVSFPTKIFTLQSINDGGSIVSFWVAPPQETASGTVAFSGMAAGGIAGAGDGWPLLASDAM